MVYYCITQLIQWYIFCAHRKFSWLPGLKGCGKEERKRMEKNTSRVIALTVCIAMLLTVVGCGGTTVPEATPAAAPVVEGIMVTAAAPKTGKLELTTNFVGTVQPGQIVSIMPKLMGTVETVNVTVGQEVKKGDLLMTLDDSDIMPSVLQAKAGYDAAKAQAQQMVGSSYKSSLANLDAQFDSAYDTYENAKDAVAELKSLKSAMNAVVAALEPLETAGTITVEEAVELREARSTLAGIDASIAQAQAGAETARKYYGNARNSYNVMKIEGQEELQAVADTTLASAEAALNAAQTQLNNTKVYSPIDGLVESVSVSALNMVSTSSPAFVISNKDSYEVSFNVPSASIAAMQVGDKVTVRKLQTDYTATITEVGTILNQQTGLFTVKAVFDNADADTLQTGITVKVTAVTKRSENAVLLAQDSVYYDNGAAYVYLNVDGYAKKTYIETGISTPEYIEVTDGLKTSDMVVTSWHPNLIDGALLAIEQQ